MAIIMSNHYVKKHPQSMNRERVYWIPTVNFHPNKNTLFDTCSRVKAEQQ